MQSFAFKEKIILVPMRWMKFEVSIKRYLWAANHWATTITNCFRFWRFHTYTLWHHFIISAEKKSSWLLFRSWISRKEYYCFTIWAAQKDWKILIEKKKWRQIDFASNKKSYIGSFVMRRQLYVWTFTNFNYDIKLHRSYIWDKHTFAW